MEKEFGQKLDALAALIHSENQELRADMIQRIGVLSEHMDDRFALVDERFVHVEKKQDKMQETLESHRDEIGKLSVEILILRDVINEKDRQAV